MSRLREDAPMLTGTRSRETQLHEFITRCQLKGVSRLALVQLGNSGLDGGGSQLDEWPIADILGDSDEEKEQFISSIIQRCSEETDAARTTGSFRLYAYLEDSDRFVLASNRLVFQVAQHNMGDDFEGTTSNSGVMKILTSHLERREYQSTEMLKMVIQTVMTTQNNVLRRLESYESAQLRTFELEQQLLDRRDEREAERKRSDASLENQQALIKQLAPLAPTVVQHVAAAVTGGRVKAPAGRSDAPDDDSGETAPSVRDAFIEWLQENADPLEELAEKVGEDAVAELMGVAQQDGAELQRAVYRWMTEHEVTKSVMVEHVGAKSYGLLAAILKE